MLKQVPSRVIWAAALMGLVAPLHAMQAMSESEMSSISGQDGLAVDFGGQTTATQVTADNLQWTLDQGTADESGWDVQNLSIQAIGPDGTAPTSPFTVSAVADVGDKSGDPALNLTANWNRTRVRAESTVFSDPGKSFGFMALDSTGSLTLMNLDGLLNEASATGLFDFSLSDGQFWLKQGNTATDPELLLDNLTFNFGFNNANVGVNSNGIYLSTPRLEFDLIFDTRYRGNPQNGEFRSDQPDLEEFLRWGYVGGYSNLSATIEPGGAWSGVTGAGSNLFYDQTSQTQGISITAVGELDTDFTWVVGEAGDPPTELYFRQWRRLDPGSRGFRLPLVAFDVVADQGTPGTFNDPTTYNFPVDLCVGANGAANASTCDANGLDRDLNNSNFYESPATGNEGDFFGVFVRDAELVSYPTEVVLRDPGVAGDPTLYDDPADEEVFGWGLLFTTSNLDINAHLYPGTSSLSRGVTVDLAWVVSSQYDSGSGQWDFQNGSHFMIADTDAEAGIGWLNSNMAIILDNVDATFEAGGIRMLGDSGTFYFDGQFGGGDLIDPSNLTRIADFVVRWNFDYMETLFEPGTSSMGYSGTFEFDETKPNLIALTEPSANDVAFTFGDMDGRWDVVNGTIDLKSAAETADGLSRLTIGHDLVIDSNNPIRAENVSFNGETLGQIVIPGGRVGARMTLKKQSP